MAPSSEPGPWPTIGPYLHEQLIWSKLRLRLWPVGMQFQGRTTCLALLVSLYRIVGTLPRDQYRPTLWLGQRIVCKVITNAVIP
jgi:hypothetical protein